MAGGDLECPMCNFVLAKGYEDMVQDNSDFAESVVTVIREDDNGDKGLPGTLQE